MDLEQGSCNQRKEISFVAVSFFRVSAYNKNSIELLQGCNLS